MTITTLLPSYTAFDGHRRLASGPLATVALAVRQAAGDAMSTTILIFDDATGRSIDLDLRGTADEIRARYAPPRAMHRSAQASRPARANSAAAAGRSSASCRARSRCCRVTGNGWPRSPAARRSRCASLSRTHGARTRKPTGDAMRRRARTTSCRRWRATCPVSRRPRARCMRTIMARLTELIAGWPDDVRDHALALARGELPPSTEDC